MRGSLLAVAAVLSCWLLLASSAHAQQEPDPLAALVGAGAPLVASTAPLPATPGHAPIPLSAASAPLPGAAQPGTLPAIGAPDIPNPFGLFGGLDPREWAGELLEAVLGALGEALLEAMRSFIDWALGLGSSSLNFVTRTPAAGTYESTTVRSLWDLSRTLANGGLALVVMWGGFNVMLRQHLRSPYDGAVELLPRVVLAALALNLSLEFSQLLIDTNNAFSALIGLSGLPGYEEAGAGQEGVALVIVAVSYGVVAVLLVFQMLMRLALINLLIVLAPVMVLLWVLPQTQGWARWWAQLFPVTVFQQAVQMVVLSLGSALMVELTPGSVQNALLTLFLGIAVLSLTLKVPSLLQGQLQQAGAVRIGSLVAAGRAAAGGR